MNWKDTNKLCFAIAIVAMVTTTSDAQVLRGKSGSFRINAKPRDVSPKKLTTTDLKLAHPILISASIAVEDPNRDGFLNGMEEQLVKVKVTNGGNSQTGEVSISTSPTGNFEGIKVVCPAPVSSIMPNQTVELSLVLSAARKINEKEVSLLIQVLESNGFDASENYILKLKCKPAETPVFAISDIVIKDQSGNSQIEPKEMAEIEVRLTNVSNTKAMNPKVKISNKPNTYFSSYSDTVFHYQNIEPNKYVDISFTAYSNMYTSKLEIAIAIEEELMLEPQKLSIALPLNSSLLQTKEIVMKNAELTAQKEKKDYTSIQFSELETNLPVFKRNAKSKLAIIIGNRDYKYADDVDFAINDARSIRNYFTQSFGIAEGNIIYIENAAKGDFETLFGDENNPQGKLANSIIEGETEVYIFYSGHGAPSLTERKPYFVPVECEPNYIHLGGYSLATFYQNLGRLKSPKICVFMDACFSGANIFKNMSPIWIKSQNALQKIPVNISVIASSSDTQLSTWYNEKQHGLFTYFLLKSFHSYKDTDANKNRKVEFAEIMRYVDDKRMGISHISKKVHGIDQTPVLLNSNPEFDYLFEY